MSSRSRLEPEDSFLLRTNPLFSALDEATFEAVLGHAVIETFEKNEPIFGQGDETRYFYQITSGTVQLYRADRDGVEKTINLFRRPASFGEASIFLGNAYPVSAQCLENTRLIRVEADCLLDPLRSNPDVAFGMLAAMSRHLKSLVDEITLLRAPTAQHRLAEFLLRHAPAGTGEVSFRLDFSKTVIAQRLGITPEMLSRTFRQLREQGVETDRDMVTIRDRDALYRLVGMETG